MIWRFGAMGARLFLGAIFFTGGLSKLMPFPGVMGPVWLQDVLEPHGLGLYARFVAVSETLIGLLLLSGRFATLGAVMLVPLLLNILMVTISMQWQGTPYVVGVFLLMNIYLLMYDYPRLRIVLLSSPHARSTLTPESGLEGTDLLVLTGFALCLWAVPVFLVSPALAYAMVASCFVAILAARLGRWRQSRATTPDADHPENSPAGHT